MGKIYYNPEKSSSFSTLKKLENALPKDKRKPQNWILKQDAYTLHKPAKKRFLRNSYRVTNIGDCFEIDLIDLSSLSSLSKYNDNYKFILMAIDVFSKLAFAEPMLSKSGISVTNAFKAILRKVKYPILQIQSDRRKEFLNKSFQNLLKTNNIEFRICKDPVVKCSVIERLNRTIKSKMYKYFTYKTFIGT